MDILRTHPMVILGGVLQKNPFFVAPAEFLAELRERGAYGARSSAARRYVKLHRSAAGKMLNRKRRFHVLKNV